MKMLLIGVVALTSVAILEALFYTFRFFSDRRRDELKRRLSALGNNATGVTSGMGGSLLRRGKLADSEALDSLLRALRFATRLEGLLEQAEVDITVAALLGYSAAGALLGLALAVFSSQTIGLVVLPLLFGFLPFAYVLMMRARRSRRLSEQLPDALEMMARSLRAGHALSTSFKLVAQEMPAPVATEFGRAFESQELGMPFERAVSEMTSRAPDNQDLKIFALSVIVQKETGGNLIEIVEKIADTVRARYKFYGKVRGLTAEGRMSSYVVGALPFFSLFVSMMFNPDYVMPLFRSDVGHYFLGYGILSWATGFFLMKRMTQIKV